MCKKCSFCKSDIEKLGLTRIDLWICPTCFATYYPVSASMAFRRELFPITRKRWLAVLENLENDNANLEGTLCIEHGVPLEKGTLPNYGYEGKIATCCNMLHLNKKQVADVLRMSLESGVGLKPTKHHFFFIRLLDKFVSRLMKTETLSLEEDPIESLQYNLYFQKILEKENEAP